jgi:hypothetical protein
MVGRSRRPGDGSALAAAAVSHAPGEPASSREALASSPPLTATRSSPGPRPRRRFPRAEARHGEPASAPPLVRALASSLRPEARRKPGGRAATPSRAPAEGFASSEWERIG